MGKLQHYKKVYSQATKKHWWFFALQIMILALLAMPVFALAVFVYFAKDLPRPESFGQITLSVPTKIYDRTGTVLLYEVFADEKREIVPLKDIPLSLQQAVIATEDADFYTHWGLSPKGTARAVLANFGLWPSKTKRQGGSTITQQLARTAFLSPDKTLSRKIRELVLTLELERNYSKDALLEFYLNQIPLGSNVYGVGAASRMYFGKRVSELTIEESAVLAALIQAPSLYSPYGNHKDDRLIPRKDYVLSRMAQVEFITKEEARAAQEKDIIFKEQTPAMKKAPHFVLYVLDQLLREYGEVFVRENGLTVRTSLDWNLQEAAEQAVADGAKRNASSNAHNSALVAADAPTGEILAMVGSKDWFGKPYPEGCVPGKDCLFDPKVNVAIYNPGRQPGSAFKPFVYAAAFMKGFNGETKVVDELTNFGVWGGQEYIPQNYDGKFRGELTLREALAQSLNIPAIKVLLTMATITDSIELARQMGITTLHDASSYGPALVLGGGEVKLLDMVSAYGVFATDGRKIPPVSILEIRDRNNRLLKQSDSTSIQILPPNIAREITSILSDNEARTPVFGPYSSLVIPGYLVAVKTGTTQEYKDAWAIGYSPGRIVAGVWRGNNNSVPTSRSGGSLSAPIWNQFMRFALPYLQIPKTS